MSHAWTSFHRRKKTDCGGFSMGIDLKNSTRDAPSLPRA